MAKSGKVEMPGKVAIGHRVYSLQEFDPGGLTEVLGRCEHTAGRLSLKAGQPPAEMADTVIHECLHAIYRMAALELGDDEERVVTVLATGLATLFHRNPDLGLWLVQELRDG